MKDLTLEPNERPDPGALLDLVSVDEKTGAEAPVFTFKPVEVTD